MFFKKKPDPGDISFYRDHRGIHINWEGHFDVVIEIFKAKPPPPPPPSEIDLDALLANLRLFEEDDELTRLLRNEPLDPAMARQLEEDCPSCAELFRQLDEDLAELEMQDDLEESKDSSAVGNL